MPVRDRQTSTAPVNRVNVLKDTNANLVEHKSVMGSNDSSDNSKSVVKNGQVPDSTPAPPNEPQNDQKNLFLSMKVSTHEAFVPKSLPTVIYRGLRKLHFSTVPPEKTLRLWRTLTLVRHLCRFLLMDYFVKVLNEGLLTPLKSQPQNVW